LSLIRPTRAAGLEQLLKDHFNLQVVDLHGTEVTDAGVRKLQQSLSGLRIQR
jgi:hypothetical protein